MTWSFGRPTHGDPFWRASCNRFLQTTTCVEPYLRVVGSTTNSFGIKEDIAPIRMTEHHLLECMANPGPKPKVSDDALLLELMICDDNSVFASEIEPDVDLGLQQLRDRLNQLVENTQYVEKKEASGRNLYSLTDAGHSHLLKQMRNHFD